MCVCVYIYITQNKGKLLLKIEEITVGKALVNTQKLNQNISMVTAVCCVFRYIHSLLIEKDSCDHRNISIMFPFVCMCLSYGDLFNFW